MGTHLTNLEIDSTDEFLNLRPVISSLSLRVDAQTLQVFELEINDQISFDLNDQTIEFIIFNSQSELKPELLQLQNQDERSISYQQSGAINTQQQCQQCCPSAQKIHAQLQQHAITETDLAQAYRLSYHGEVTFKALQAVRVVVCNTGLDMLVNTQICIEEVKVTILKNLPQQHYLPPALAIPIKEIHIPRASAKSYTVKAGQWIQIIDLSGKQCSDFLAFDEKALSNGREIGLDLSATRTILGHATPVPGLHAKFFATDMKPLIEVVQDTVGRHDMFLTACSPKFYNDAGYFNHVSCSDNFNRVLQKFNISPKAAWPAINFFYNTSVTTSGEITMAEPWSQPGDFILLRASRDLVCASSACPDDIDPSNGWVPTDIYVRIYDEHQFFPRSQHYRIDPEEQPRMTQSSGFFSRIQTISSKISEYKGYWVADEYDAWGSKAEYLACRERVAMIDLSALRKFEITGPDAEVFLQYALTRNIRKLAIGEIAYSASCLETGGMVDDGTIFRMGENNFRWICGDEYSGTWFKKIAQEQGYRVSIRNSSKHIHNIALQGPHSRALLEQIIWTPEHQPNITDLAWFHFTHAKLNGPDGIPLMVSRTGYTGELGFEIWCHPSHAEHVWDSIWQIGQQYNIAPLGFHALDMLRIEAGLIFAQHEFSAETNPYEAGIGFTVPMKTKEEDFIGKQAMKNQSAESRHKLVGLILDDNEDIHHGDLIYDGRFPIGVVTSSTNSPILCKKIALCRIAPQFSAIGTAVQIGQLDGLKKRIKAKVVSLPFYDPERTRVRS